MDIWVDDITWELTKSEFCDNWQRICWMALTFHYLVGGKTLMEFYVRITFLGILCLLGLSSCIYYFQLRIKASGVIKSYVIDDTNKFKVEAPSIQSSAVKRGCRKALSMNDILQNNTQSVEYQLFGLNNENVDGFEALERTHCAEGPTHKELGREQEQQTQHMEIQEPSCLDDDNCVKERQLRSVGEEPFLDDCQELENPVAPISLTVEPEAVQKSQEMNYENQQQEELLPHRTSNKKQFSSVYQRSQSNMKIRSTSQLSAKYDMCKTQSQRSKSINRLKPNDRKPIWKF